MSDIRPYPTDPERVMRAPSREENISGLRVFAYVAEIDVLGWKFRLLGSGNIVIETPTPVGATGPLYFEVNAAHVGLLRALLDLPGEDTVTFPGAPNQGVVG